MTKQLEDLFDQVTQRVDEEYVDSETQFIQNGDDASSFLRLQKRTCADPFGRFMARTIAGWIDRKSDEYKQALDFLDRTERRVKGSPVGTPRPNVTSEDLTVIYERRLTTFFALRLVKQPGWPAWKVETVLRYLAHHKDASTLPALIRFVVETADAAARELAVKTIDAIGGPASTLAWIEEVRYWRAQAQNLSQP